MRYPTALLWGASLTELYLLKGHMSYTPIPIHIVVRNMSRYNDNEEKFNSIRSNTISGCVALSGVEPIFGSMLHGGSYEQKYNA